MIELLSAMAASTILLVSMAATVTIAANLLESPIEDDTAARDREIADRLTTDLRHATSFSMPSSTELRIIRPDAREGSPVGIDYEMGNGGLIRRLESDPVIQLDPQTPQYESLADEFAAPADQSHRAARLRTTQTASSIGATDSLTIDLPAGSCQGDLLLLCIAGNRADSFSISDGSWQTVANRIRSSTRLTVMYRFHPGGNVDPVVIGAQPSSSIAAVMLAVENVDGGSPVTWADTDSGYAYPPFYWTYPSFLEPANVSASTLNIQILAADGDPWHDASLGLASFADVARITAAPSSYYYRASLGVALRSGSSPTLDTAPVVWFYDQRDWVQAAIFLEPAE